MAEHSASIADRVEVRPHPTVVRLDDLEAANSAWLTDSFLLTPEVNAHLIALRQLFNRPNGCGIFLIGHYGCGKSHFLAYLIQQLLTSDFVSPCPLTASVSLVNFSADNRLEDIVAKSLNLQIRVGDRREIWNGVFEDGNTQGLVLVLDELSEFLRSKPDARAFTEDIRFLQFLGEWAQDKRFWIVAAMQEAIEHTGELEYGLYRKIKDRYPLRLLLTPAHVQTLIADSILTKKSGYQAGVDQLVVGFRQYFTHSGFDEALFKAIYPLHPVTLELLEEVRDRFSQARGVVDFVVSRLRGDPVRNIEPFLDQPWGNLLTPDAIVDHFRDLFQVQPEFIPLAQQVLPWYQKNLDTLFEKTALRVLAEQLLKLLILCHLSPARETLSSEQAVEWLMFGAIRTDPARNRAIILKVLTSLAEHGRYVVGKGHQFRLNLKDTGRAQLEKLLIREVESLKGQDVLILETLTPMLPADGINPFRLPRNQWQHRRVLWHFHERRFAVWFGEDPPSQIDDLALCIRPPWGQPDPPVGIYILEPAQVTVSEDMIELAALVRLGEQPLSPELSKTIGKRLQSRIPTFQRIIQSIWIEATLITPEGHREAPPRVEKQTSLDGWLESLAIWILRRRYPAFERFAPAHGPLPKEAWLRLMRFAISDDLGRVDADDYVKLIREAYLVPMGLMRRRGRDYALPTSIEKVELVKLLMPLLNHSPSPKAIHQHLAEPIYGLVPDQVNLLLVFLLIQGEIDILKDRKSYRESFEILSNPLQYDRVELGHALSTQQLDAMQRLCEGLNIVTPKQWTVLAQRRIVEKLCDRGRRDTDRLQDLLVKLQSAEVGQRLLKRLQNHIHCWTNLSKGDHSLQGFEHFQYEVSSISGFLEDVHAFEDLPERLPRLIAELQRLQHLFNHPALRENAEAQVIEQIQNLPKAPSLDRADALDQWLAAAGEIYEVYKADYIKKHQHWWKDQSGHAIWDWQPPRVANSRHVGLADALTSLDSLCKEARQRKCLGLVNLDYQPLCTCGFTGSRAPIEETFKSFEALSEQIEIQLRLFFQQDTVKERIREWKQEGFEPNEAMNSYLEGKQCVPEVADIALFDKYLSGTKLAQDVDPSVFLEIFSQRVWEPAKLVKAIERELSRFDGQRLQFSGWNNGQNGLEDLAEWCAEQCLRFGISLPENLSPNILANVSQSLRSEWVSESAVLRLAKLGLDTAGQDKILNWLIDGRVVLPSTSRDSKTVLFAVEHLLHPQDLTNPEELACVSESLYRHHFQLYRLAGKKWLDRLKSVANAPLRPLPVLPDLLNDTLGAQWLVIDCLGIALIGSLQSIIDHSFNAWQRKGLRFADVSADTTTDGFYRQLLNHDIDHPFEKCNVIDQLIHRCKLPFDDLGKLAATELDIALKMALPKFDRSRDLVVFADHGFRLSADGRCYEHGTGSRLEQIVPVWHYVPSGR